MKKIFVITYQPKTKSDKETYFNEFITASTNAGNDIRILNIHDIDVDYLKFDNNLPEETLSKELKEAQNNILWADQIVLSYSVWCMNIPAKLKAFIERIFQGGVLVKPGKMGPEPIFDDKTLVIMQSYGMPYLFMKYTFGDLPFKFLKMVFEKWCGFKIIKRIDIDLVDNINTKRHAKLINEIREFAYNNK